MKLEGASTTPESRESRLAREYHEAVINYQRHKEVTPEASELIFRDRPAASDAERAVAGVNLQQEACAGDAEAYGQQGKEGAERVSRMLEQFVEAKQTILRLYLDAMSVSEELATIIRDEQPWVQDALRAANDDSYDEVEKKVA